MKRPSKTTSMTALLLVVFIVILGVMFWRRSHPAFYIEAKITAVPICGSEYCSASYEASDKSGQKYFINTGVPREIDGNSEVKCLKVQSMQTGDIIQFNLRLQPPPANALTTSISYSTCFPAHQNNGYFIKVL